MTQTSWETTLSQGETDLVSRHFKHTGPCSNPVIQRQTEEAVNEYNTAAFIHNPIYRGFSKTAILVTFSSSG